MADLYTSLIRAKQELNGGVLPAMTPIPEKLHAVVDPEFTIGMGALMEDPEKGLRCPVRGCGKYFARLTQHLDGAHSDLGGQAAIKKALDIPPSAPLITEAFRAKLRESGRRLAASQRGTGIRSGRRPNKTRATGNYANTVGAKNFRNSCEAQIRQRLFALQERLGRAPSAAEARALDKGLDGVVMRLYGTWNNGLASVGLATIRSARHNAKKVAREAALESLAAWYEEHGELPSARDAVRVRLPVLHSYPVYLKAFSVDKDVPHNRRWTLAMQRAAAVLGIRGGRYGVPLQSEAAD